MPRLLTPALFAFQLAVLQAFAQVGGSLPAAAEPPATTPAPVSTANPESSAHDDPVIGHAREVAVSFAETLPDFIARQITTRYWGKSGNRRAASWLALDVVTADVVCSGGKEIYLNIVDNGKPTTDASLTGAWSEGEFATGLQALFSPLTAAEFGNPRPETKAGRAVWKYDYTVEQPHSGWRIEAGGQTYKPSYTGAVWIDKETFRVLQIQMTARNMPPAFPIDATESSISYDFVPIGDQQYLLPVHSESLSCWRGTKECSRNSIDFRNYRKYTADTSINFDVPPPEK